MKKSRFTDTQTMGVLKQAEVGMPLAELCRTHAISAAMFYKWRSKFGGMDASMMAEHKAIQEKNRRLKKMFAEVSMQNELLKEALTKMTRPAQRRELVEDAVMQRQMGVALACRTFGISETCYRYEGKLGGENERIKELLLGLAQMHRTWGFSLCFLYLRHVKGHGWNHRRV